MVDYPRPNWGDTSWSEVERYIAESAPPKTGFDWSKFWNDFLWFGVPPDELYRRGADVVQEHVADPFSRMGREVASDAAGIVRGASDAAADAAVDAAGNTWRTVAPYLAVGALVLLVLEVQKAR